MDTGDSPNASSPRSRNRGGTRGGAGSRPRAVDDGADPDPAAGHPPLGPMSDWECEDESFLEWRSRRGDFSVAFVRAHEFALRRRSSAARRQAYSAAARPSDHPGAERTGSRTRVRQSVLYSDRPRHSRRRRPTELVEHPSEVSSSELDVTNLAPLEALSVTDSSTAFPSQTEEYPSEASITELGRAVTDLPTLDALSLRESPLLTPQAIGEESEDEDDVSSHIYGSRDVGGTFYSSSSKGLIRSLPHSDTLAEELQRPDSDEEPEETQDQIQYLLDAHSPCTIRELVDSILAAQHAPLTAQAAEHGTELPTDPFLVVEESQPQHASAEAALPLPSMTPSHKTSTEENIEDGKKWMRDEVKLCLKKHIEKTPHHTGVEFEFAELCHQCFNVESYTKVFHHYNFKMRMKMPTSSEWTMELYLAEVKEIFGRKFYFCCPLEPNESGHCNACKNQEMDDLKHPVTGGFEVGLPDAPKSNFWCLDEDEW